MSSDNANRWFIAAWCAETARVIGHNFDHDPKGVTRFIVSLSLFVQLDHMGLRGLGLGAALSAVAVRALLVAVALPKHRRGSVAAALAVHSLLDLAGCSRENAIGMLIGMFFVDLASSVKTAFSHCRGTKQPVNKSENE